MENYENEEMWQEPLHQESVPAEPEQPAYQPDPCQQPYHGTGAGRKESPFANSPYVMNQNQQSTDPYRYQSAYVPPVPPQEPPRKPKKQKTGNGRKVWKAVLCAVLAIVLVAGSCGMTAYVINNKWESRTDMMIDSFENRMNQLQEQIDAAKQQDTIVGYPNVSYTITPPGAIYQNNVESVVLISAIIIRIFGGDLYTYLSSLYHEKFDEITSTSFVMDEEKEKEG